MLLAVDAGLRCGLAWFDGAGRLTRYRSTHFPRRRDLAGAAWRLLADASHLALEGGGGPADPWLKAAERRGIPALQIGAEAWRTALLLDREQRSGGQAKAAADPLARAVIAWSGLPRPTSLRHDAAEAILLGWWAVNGPLGWVADAPDLHRLAAR
ncbi:MAG: hypothetical protein H6702_22060 [Myxococcales bacterium]|nr:hypothetical protein [Myxococcales bacterium]